MSDLLTTNAMASRPPVSCSNFTSSPAIGAPAGSTRRSCKIPAARPSFSATAPASARTAALARLPPCPAALAWGLAGASVSSPSASREMSMRRAPPWAGMAKTAVSSCSPSTTACAENLAPTGRSEKVARPSDLVVSVSLPALPPGVVTVATTSTPTAALDSEPRPTRTVTVPAGKSPTSRGRATMACVSGGRAGDCATAVRAKSSNTGTQHHRFIPSPPCRQPGERAVLPRSERGVLRW